MEGMADISLTRTDGVVTITLDRPEKKNALTSAMYAELADAVTSIADDPGDRVLVIQGSESVFTAGNDVAEFLNDPPIDLESPVLRFLRALAVFPKPLVAAVCGPAVGVGTTLLLHCDLVYAGDDAVLSLPFVNLGLCPEAASSLLLPQRIGHVRAAAALLLGDPIDASTALGMGLVNAVAPPSQIAGIAADAARRLAAKPLAAVVAAKALMKAGQQDTVLTRIDEEASVFARMLHEPAAKEAFTAFLEKRRPDFSGL
jgi:enoyl-CoA hydratase/carnithine racemase